MFRELSFFEKSYGNIGMGRLNWEGRERKKNGFRFENNKITTEKNKKSNKNNKKLRGR